MAQKISKWKKFKRFLKRNMTPTWAKHFSYQVFAFLTSVAMIVGVADYAVTKSYAERKLTLMDDFTITAHTGAFDTEMNTIDSVKAAIKNKAEVIELDIRQRPDKTVVMSHDLVVTNNDATELEEALKLIKDVPDMKINFDIKETRGIMLQGGETLEDMYKERLPLYNKWAQAVINCGQNTVEQTARAIVRASK